MTASCQYVALGSSFAAGAGLGSRLPGSPRLCLKTSNGYPQQLARLCGMSLEDVTCSGATARHVLFGGQYFQKPQIDALKPGTELVTLTVGGNDIGYVGDLMLLSYRARNPLLRRVLDALVQVPRLPEKRDFEGLAKSLRAILVEITRRSPNARRIVVTYPVILPPDGTCSQLGLEEADVLSMRGVGERLAEVTRVAAERVGATIVDMTIPSAGHDACSGDPWVFGNRPAKGGPFHPTLAGAVATAECIKQALGRPTTVLRS